jgi:hypothetical protein
MRIVAGLVMVATGGDATAGAATPPSSLTLPDLMEGHRWGGSLTVLAGLGVIGLAIEAGGGYAVADLELFASVSAIAFAGCVVECPVGTPSDAALSNARVGGRYVVTRGPITIAPALWGWVPTTTASDLWRPRARAVMTSASDSRAFLDQGALGGALDLAWRGETALVHGQVGAAVVADGGPQIDNVFAALGAGVRASEKSTLLGEWRVDAYPREPKIHVFGIGMSRGDADHRTWRIRLHGVRGGMKAGGASLAFDLVQRW